MNRTVLSAALLLSLAAPAAFAQRATPQTQSHRRHRAHNPHKAAMRMSRKLGLSQDQTAKLEPIFAARQQKMQTLKADTTLTPDQKKEQRRQIQQNTRAELSAVLTPDQMQQLKSMRKAHRHTAAGA